MDRAVHGPWPEPPTIHDRAALLLLRGIAQDHPFLDGNKRTAYQATEVFLARNGLVLDAEQDEAVGFMVAVARGQMPTEEIAAWLHERSSEGHV